MSTQRGICYNFDLYSYDRVYTRVENNSALVLSGAPKLPLGAPDVDVIMHASCTVVSSGDWIAHQML